MTPSWHTLEESIGNGGTSLGDRQYVYPNGTLGQQQEQLAVYDARETPVPAVAIRSRGSSKASAAPTSVRSVRNNLLRRSLWLQPGCCNQRPLL
jgi:hypothetical protein